MRNVKMVAVAAAFLVGGINPSHAQSAEDAFGVWLHPENGSHVRLSKCRSSRLCATVIKPSKAGSLDVKNPNEKLRNRKISGLQIMKGAKKTGDATWSGKLYNPTDGKTYNGTITVLSRNKMRLQGCVLGGLICKGPTWSRIR